MNQMIRWIIRGAGAISALVAVATLVFSSYHYINDNMEQRVREWQSVIIYSIIEKNVIENGSNSGLSFQEIKSRYLQEAQTFDEFDIPKKEISDISLKKALLWLQSVHVIERDTRNLYSIFEVQDFRTKLMTDELNTKNYYYMRARERIISELFNINCVASNYNFKTLYSKITDDKKITKEIFSDALQYLKTNGTVLQSTSGNFCLSSEYIQQQMPPSQVSIPLPQASMPPPYGYPTDETQLQ